VHGPEGFKKQIREHRAAFPDLRFSIHSIVADGDEVIVRWTASGTHRGSLTGETPTAKRVEVSGFGSWRISGGKVAEHWGVIDLMSLLQQIGVL
jgi:predicted ester cyclase